MSRRLDLLLIVGALLALVMIAVYVGALGGGLR